MIRNVSCVAAAKLMGTSQAFVREGLKNGTLPFGTAALTRPDSQRMTFYISSRKFMEFTGCTMDEIEAVEAQVLAAQRAAAKKYPKRR